MREQEIGPVAELDTAVKGAENSISMCLCCEVCHHVESYWESGVRDKGVG